MTRQEKVNLLNELLDYEENNDIGNLTRAERREFQQWISKALEQGPTAKNDPIDYYRAFKIACELLNGSVLYGIDADRIYEIMMAKDGVVSSDSYGSYILNNLQELDKGQYVSESTTKNDLPSVTSQELRWIPVSERLPEDGEIVIASVDGEYVYSEARYSKESGWEWAAESSYDYWADLNGVDAWMPLPKAYKSESDGKE